MAQIYLPERTDIDSRAQRTPVPGLPNSKKNQNQQRYLKRSDTLVIVLLVGVIALIIAGASRATVHTRSVTISLSPFILPLYAGYSLLRMIVAYIISLIFTLVYGHIAATNKLAQRFMIPILDILQSIPILSFLPSVVLTLVALFPHSSIGVELAAAILIFTSQAWNMTFSFYHSAATIPAELQEAAAIYRLSPWRRFLKLEVAYSMIGLIWNSMMSWAGGWFFLVAAEQLTLGSQSYQLPGLGSYIQVAANQGNITAMAYGLITLVVMIVLLDVLLWRPVVAWADKFKFEMAKSSETPNSPVLDLLQRSRTLETIQIKILHPTQDFFAALLDKLFPAHDSAATAQSFRRQKFSLDKAAGWVITAALILAGMIGLLQAARLLLQVRPVEWLQLLGMDSLTLLRTFLAMAISFVWAVPAGTAIGMNPNLSRRLQPIVQVVASIPATALFPIILLLALKLPAGINVAAIILMLLGTQWYVLFNVIAGAMAIPTDLREAAQNFHVIGWRRWKILIFPAIFPYLVTGMITASGGAWNASIVAEYVQFGGKTFIAPGLGSSIAQAAANGSIPILLASTLLMAATVVTMNRLVWRRLYKLAERRFTLA